MKYVALVWIVSLTIGCGKQSSSESKGEIKKDDIAKELHSDVVKMKPLERKHLAIGGKKGLDCSFRSLKAQDYQTYEKVNLKFKSIFRGRFLEATLTSVGALLPSQTPVKGEISKPRELAFDLKKHEIKGGFGSHRGYADASRVMKKDKIYSMLGICIGAKNPKEPEEILVEIVEKTETLFDKNYKRPSSNCFKDQEKGDFRKGILDYVAIETHAVGICTVN